MSSIHIRKSHSAGFDKAKTAMENAARAISDRYGVDYEWRDNEIHFQRSGVDGVMRVFEDAVEVEARLGFLLAMMKGPIEEEIDRQLDEHLA